MFTFVLVDGRYAFLFIHSSVDGSLVHFHLLTIVSYVAMDIVYKFAHGYTSSISFLMKIAIFGEGRKVTV